MPLSLRPVTLTHTQWLRLPLLFLLLAIPATAAAQNGTVSGTVTEEGTGLPVPGVFVAVTSVSGGFVAQAIADAGGAYSLSVPPGALYFLVAGSSSSPHVPEAYPDVPCPTKSCTASDLTLATPFSLAAGATLTGRDFVLARGGTITGTVTNATTGAAASATVTAWGRVGSAVFGVSRPTNASGVYTLAGLYPGTYYLGTSNGQGLRDEIYDNIPCVAACTSAAAVLLGTPVPVTDGATASGRDFALDPGGRISGVVTNAATGQPVQNVSVQAYSRVGTGVMFGGSANTNAAGEYTINGLAAANWAVLTSTTLLINEIYGDIRCPVNCSSTTAVDSGTPVAVTLDTTAGGVNFALAPGGSISGTVTNEVTGSPIQNYAVVAAFRTTTTNQTRTAVTNASGTFTISGLLPGTYALYTSGNGFTNEIFDNIPCPVTCNTGTALNTGTPMEVAADATTANRNFALQPLTGATTGTLNGTLTDSATGLPMAGISLEIYIVSGSSLSFVRTVSTGINGTYSASLLPPGSYRVATFGMHPYRNEAFDNVPCVGNFCAFSIISGSTPINLTAGSTATANFGLSVGDGIAGRVTSAAGSPIANATLNVYQVPSGAVAGTTTTNVEGRFLARGIPNGEYVIFTSNSPGYFNEIYNNIRCTTTCSASTAISSGTRITLTGAALTVEPGLVSLVSGIDFALDPRDDVPAAPSNLRVVTESGTARFVWAAPSLATGGEPTSYLLEAGLSPGTTFVNLPIAGTGTSFSVPGVPPGTFYVRIRGVNAAGTGPASNEVILVVGAGGLAIPDPPTSVQAFMSGELLTMTWTPPVSGGPPSGYVIEAGSATGLSNIATLNVAGPVFSFSPVPNGFYFLRVRSRNAAGVSVASAEVMINAGNVPAPPGAPNFSSHSVSSGTVTLTWQAPTQGTATSYIIEAGSATGLSNLAVVNTGSTAVTQSFSGVPSGTYYVRVRAVNAQGASIASNERIITVP